MAATELIEKSAKLPVCRTKGGVRRHVDAMSRISYLRCCQLLADQDTTLNGLVDLIWQASQAKKTAGVCDG